MHTFYSDGTSSPQEVVQEASERGLACIAITDHDTLEAVPIAQQEAKNFNIEIVPGVELSTEMDGKDIHLLGYFMDCAHGPLVAALTKAQEGRVLRIQEMIDKLKKLGVDNIELNEVCALTQSKSVGRPHLAKILKEKGWVVNYQEAFNKYLAEGAVAYVGKYKISPEDGIRLIRESGGVAVLAHPMCTNRDELIPQFVKAGLQGVEVYYPNFSEASHVYYEGIARKHNLAMTGGSDAHGKAKENTHIGKVKIPYELVEELKKLAKK